MVEIDKSFFVLYLHLHQQKHRFPGEKCNKRYSHSFQLNVIFIFVYYDVTAPIKTLMQKMFEIKSFINTFCVTQKWTCNK